MRTLALACPHEAASKAGQECFEQGGNAVDAALAACCVLAVVYPHMCTIGGDLFALVHAPNGEIVAYNGSGAAPAGLDGDSLHRAHETMPLTGPDTITVPGVLSAWTALARNSRLGLPAVMQAGIGFAQEGCTVSRSLARAIERDVDVISADPGLSSIFLSSCSPLREGDSFAQPALAETMTTIAEHGDEAFYEGALGADYVRGLAGAGSVMSPDDLAQHKTTCTMPLECDYHGWQIATTPPNSQGYSLLLILKALERLSLPIEALGSNAGVLARVFRLVSRDRDEVLCDPEYLRVSPRDLVGDMRVGAISKEISHSLASPGPPTEGSPHAKGVSGDTVAVVTADSQGWGASIIQSIFHSFGSGLLEPKTGILSHNRGACFSLDPLSPNFLKGGRRPAHTLMPVMVKRFGRLAVVAGTMGGRAQPQIHAQLLGRVLDSSTSLSQILAKPRWVVGSLDAGGPENVVFAEEEAIAKCGQWLAQSGMQVDVVGEESDEVGHSQYIRVDASAFEAASDPRADGVAAVSSSRTSGRNALDGSGSGMNHPEPCERGSSDEELQNGRGH